MANEITLNDSLAYADSEGADVSLEIANAQASVTTKKYVKAKQNIGTSEEAIGLGEVTSLGYALFINRDITNYIDLRVGTGGTKFARLYPGKSAKFFFGPGITAPYAIADTSPCQMEYLICSQ